MRKRANVELLRQAAAAAGPLFKPTSEVKIAEATKRPDIELTCGGPHPKQRITEEHNRNQSS